MMFVNICLVIMIFGSFSPKAWLIGSLLVLGCCLANKGMAPRMVIVKFTHNNSVNQAVAAIDHASFAHGAAISSATDVTVPAAHCQSARFDPCWSYLCHIIA